MILMPDTWEYPWFAAWDLAFHAVALAHVDPDLAKAQLLLLGREWYQHPNGQLPAYEWAFDDVNPPVQAWAALARVQPRRRGRTSTSWPGLPQAAAQLHLVGQPRGCRREQHLHRRLPGPGQHRPGRPVTPAARVSLAQADATAWMALYCLGLLNLAVQLAGHDPTYEDLAITFFEHFALIADAFDRHGLWDEPDGFYYDMLRGPDGIGTPVRVRSIVGVIPLFATKALRQEDVRGCPARQGRSPSGLRTGAQRGRRTAADGGRRGDEGRARRILPPCSTRPSSCPRTGCAPCPAGTPTTRSASSCPAGPRASATSPRSPPPACSAATPTGAARCGCR